MDDNDLEHCNGLLIYTKTDMIKEGREGYKEGASDTNAEWRNFATMAMKSNNPIDALALALQHGPVAACGKIATMAATPAAKPDPRKEFESKIDAASIYASMQKK